MKILIVANHYAVCSARYAADAFTRLGHDVRHVGPERGHHIWGLTLPARYTWEPDGSAFAGLYAGGDMTPDLVIAMDSDPVVLDYAARRADDGGELTVVWGVDSHVRDYRRPHFAHYFLAHKRVSVMEWITPRQSGPNADMTHLPCAYDPTVFTPSPIPWAEREYDVAMIGVMYPQRWRVVNDLKAAGLKVLAGTGLVYENMAAAYHNSRISLCLSAAGDVAQRVFETAACGTIVLSDNCPDFQSLQPTGFWIYEDGANLVDAVRQILAQPAEAERNIEASLEWVRDHTWDARAQVIVDWVEKNVARKAVE